ncbi:formate/nitrite transporter family protein [Roseobacteraceae bacterium NS-SX3]
MLQDNNHETLVESENETLVEKESEKEAVKEASGLSPRLIFETIRRNGDEELNRHVRALWWSGVAAGILISFSVLGKALLRAYLPDAPWRHLVESLGYSLGFLMVILGRMQLFTENTITTVVPVMMRRSRECVIKAARLWGIVLLANVTGAFLISAFLVFLPVLEAKTAAAVTDISLHAMELPPLRSLVAGIPAGILIASIVWMLPSAQNTEIALIVIFTWIMSAAGLTHIVAGSVEMAYLLWQGLLGVPEAVFGFFVPVLIGNILGGTAVFTMLTYAQIQPEIEEKQRNR